MWVGSKVYCHMCDKDMLGHTCMHGAIKEKTTFRSPWGDLRGLPTCFRPVSEASPNTKTCPFMGMKH